MQYLVMESSILEGGSAIWNCELPSPGSGFKYDLMQSSSFDSSSFSFSNKQFVNAYLVLRLVQFNSFIKVLDRDFWFGL